MYATDGDETLGGSDLDLCLYDIIKHKVHFILFTLILSSFIFSYPQFQHSHFCFYILILFIAIGWSSKTISSAADTFILLLLENSELKMTIYYLWICRLKLWRENL